MKIIVSPQQYMAIKDLARDIEGMQSEAASGTAWLDGIISILNDGTAFGKQQVKELFWVPWPKEGHEIVVDFARKAV